MPGLACQFCPMESVLRLSFPFCRNHPASKAFSFRFFQANREKTPLLKKCLLAVAQGWLLVLFTFFSPQFVSVMNDMMPDRRSISDKRRIRPILGFRDGAVVKALASHQCGPGLIPRLGVKCGLSLMVLYSAPRGFPRVLRFPLSSKTNIWLDLC